MDVDFNNLRILTANYLDSLIKKLNKLNLDEADLLEDDIENLRQCVWTMLCVYKEGDENFKPVWEEVEKNGGIARFKGTN